MILTLNKPPFAVRIPVCDDFETGSWGCIYVVVDLILSQFFINPTTEKRPLSSPLINLYIMSACFRVVFLCRRNRWNLHSFVVCGLIWHRSKGVMCENWRRTREILISVDIIIFRAYKLWQIVRWNWHLSRNRFCILLRFESKTLPLSLMYISF
jgi:hypothetical protein